MYNAINELYRSLNTFRSILIYRVSLVMNAKWKVNHLLFIQLQATVAGSPRECINETCIYNFYNLIIFERTMLLW